MSGKTGDWCILRTSGPKTLPLAASLTAAGFDVWTPIETKTRRVVKANVKRRLSSPMLPGYLFAAADRALDLFAIHADPNSVHPSFQFMLRPDLGLALVADQTLEPLRSAVRRRQPLVERHIHKGDRVKLSGGFEGLFGIVDTTRGQYAMISIPGFKYSLKVAAWQLLQEEPEEVKRIAA